MDDKRLRLFINELTGHIIDAVATKRQTAPCGSCTAAASLCFHGIFLLGIGLAIDPLAMVISHIENTSAFPFMQSLKEIKLFQAKLKTTCTTALVSLVTVVGMAAAQAADYPATTSSTSTAPKASSAQSTSSAVSDTSIGKRVEKALQENNVKGIYAKSDMGVVSLKGTVPSEEMRIALARIAASVEGVQGVETTGLKVKDDL